MPEEPEKIEGRLAFDHVDFDLYGNRILSDVYKRQPYGTVASLYLWAIAGGAIEGMKDYAPKKK